MSATVIIPTTGASELSDAVGSVLNQTYETKCYVVADGVKHHSKTRLITDNFLNKRNLERCFLPINVGANGFYGHRVYAAFTHLIDTDYVLYLDQDCWFEPNHVQSCIETIEKNDLDWSYSLRKVYNKDGKYLCNDDCESLGKWPVYFNKEVHHIDTSCFAVKRDVAVRIGHAWYGQWGADRQFFSNLSKHFPKFDCTNAHTSCYRLDGNPNSVTKEFFEKGNSVMEEKYGNSFPWKTGKLHQIEVGPGITILP